MKKTLFAIVLTACVLSSFNARALATAHEPMSPEPQTSMLNSTKLEDTADGITLESLQAMTSWEDLVTTVLPITDITGKDNKEDYYIGKLVKSCNSLHQKMTAFHDLPFVSLSIGGIKLQDINRVEFLQKFDAVLTVYNSTYNSLQLVTKPHILNDVYMQVDVQSTNLQITHISQKVVLRTGATYWESAYNYGSGKSYTATDENSYIPDDYVVFVNGYYSPNECDTTYYTPYYSITEDESISENEIEPSSVMVHICTKDVDLGWVNVTDIMGFAD